MFDLFIHSRHCLGRMEGLFQVADLDVDWLALEFSEYFFVERFVAEA